MRTQLVMIQATAFCNIDCKYCYLPNRAAVRRIKLETLERIFQCLFTSPFIADEILFLWHAGEPLVLPVSFYEQAFALQERWNENKVRISNAFQTNATLITQKWCQFFQEHGVHVGVSLDGPQAIHDARRVDRAGRGTFERAMRGVGLLEANHIAYTAISVITSASVQQPEAFWRFFSTLHPVSVGLNPEEVEGVNESSSLCTEEDVTDYKQFVAKMLELNEQHPGVHHPIREIDKLLGLLESAAPAIQAQTNVPMAIINFDCDGNFSTFSPELLSMTHPRFGDFLFGNVWQNALEDIFHNPKFQQIYGEIQEGIKQCQETCPYFAVCGGGSPSNKLHENGTFNSTETMACRLQIQAPTDAVLEHLEAKYHLVPS
ncbi:MAG TPA: cyclophane-forming radical SAM/SPASM peptide maturase GrrM/OscB [Ktedonobacteraceae bacterium]